MPTRPLGKMFEPQNGNVRAERRAWQCLEFCRRKLNLAELPLPVPVDLWIETALDIRFGVADLSHLGKDVLGAAFIREHEILINEAVFSNEGRFRFTCAHEIGHFMLHANVAAVFRDGALPNEETTDRLERQADRFAAAFLMPLDILEQELIRVCRESGLDAQHCLSEMMMPTSESFWLWNEVMLPAMMKRFGVSKTAAVLRCGTLRLATQPDRSFLPGRIRDQLLSPTPKAASSRTLCIGDGGPGRLESQK